MEKYTADISIIVNNSSHFNLSVICQPIVSQLSSSDYHYRRLADRFDDKKRWLISVLTISNIFLSNIFFSNIFRVSIIKQFLKSWLSGACGRSDNRMFTDKFVVWHANAVAGAMTRILNNLA